MTNTIATATNTPTTTGTTPTPSAMNNYMRTKPYMATDKDVKDEAKTLGYQYVGTWRCGACAEEMTIAAQSVGYTGVVPPWGKANNCALKFKKKDSTVVACRCGWRKNITIKSTKIDKPMCSVLGCTHTLHKDDFDGVCVPCRKTIAEGFNPNKVSKYCRNPTNGACSPYAGGGEASCWSLKCAHYDREAVDTQEQEEVAPVRVCNRVNCNNPVPADRKAACYSCVPKHQGVVM
jgi:hypothetical protein